MKAKTILSYFEKAVEAGKEARKRIIKANEDYKKLTEEIKRQFSDKYITEKARREQIEAAQQKLAEEIKEAQAPLNRLAEEFSKAVLDEIRINPESIDSRLMTYLSGGIDISVEEMQDLADRYADNPTMQRYLKAFWEPKAKEIKARNEERGAMGIPAEPFEVQFGKDQTGNIDIFQSFCSALKTTSRTGWIPEQYTKGAVKIKDLHSYFNQRAQEHIDYIELEKNDDIGDIESVFPVETEGSYVGGIIW